MDRAEFERMVARLEAQSARAPRAYQAKVALLAMLGFALLALILGFAGLALLLLGGVLAAIVLTGGKALLLLVKLGKLLLLIAVPLWLLLKSSLSALFARLPAPEGSEITRRQAPALFEALDRMRERMKGPRFHHVLITDEVNAAVVQRPLFGLFGFPRNYLILGLPLLESLPPEEALAVVAHEYGHLAGSHGRFAAFIYRLRISWGVIQELAQQWKGFAGRRLQRMVAWYAPYFNAYTFVLARTNEYQADAASAELVGAQVAAGALKRTNVAIAAHQRFMEEVFGVAREQAVPPTDLAERWAARAHAAVADPAAADWLQRALDRQADVTDTHPILRQRLAALGDAAEAGSPLPQPLQQGSAAEAWLGELAPLLRRAHQEAWHSQVAERWRSHFEEWEAKRARLAELQQIAEPSAEQRLQRLNLLLQLQPRADHLPALAAFNAEHPDHPLGLYLEAGLRLDRGEAAGLQLLERAMALDADAIKPGCERAFAFLREQHDEAGAERYAERWRERDRWETEREAQLEQLHVEHELRAPELPAQAWEQVQALVRAQAKGVARAWLARRVIPADPQALSYVLCLELKPWARWRRQQGEVVQRLAQQEWPLHLFICTLDGQHKPLAARVRALADAEIPMLR
ncbi:MAG: M48 family metalloprotease [Pseudomonadota bacterium]